MDVYGYSYRYNQPDELANQMFAQQALATSVPYNRDQAPHYMPAPSGDPWNAQGVTWGLPSPPQVVQFTAQPTMASMASQTLTPVVHCKRKSLDVEPVIPAKQLITEEKMAAHLNSLHISSDFTPHRLAPDEAMEMEPLGTDTASALAADKLKGRVVLSDVLKQIKDEPLLPAALIERLEKPRMSLVLWKPKEEILKVKTSETDDDKADSKDEDEAPVKRNGLLVAEHCTMDVEM